MWNIAPIAHALWHRKAGALLIATQVALTLAILCNALGVVLDRRDQASRPTGTDEDNLLFLQVVFLLQVLVFRSASILPTTVKHSIVLP